VSVKEKDMRILLFVALLVGFAAQLSAQEIVCGADQSEK